VTDPDQRAARITDLEHQFQDARAEETAYAATCPSGLDIAKGTAAYTDEQRTELARIRKRQRDGPRAQPAAPPDPVNAARPPATQPGVSVTAKSRILGTRVPRVSGTPSQGVNQPTRHQAGQRIRHALCL
jgi:hypothetical protein